MIISAKKFNTINDAILAGNIDEAKMLLHSMKVIAEETSRARASEYSTRLTKARNKFNAQFNKTNEVKGEILMASFIDSCDPTKLMLEFIKSAERLTDSYSFNSEADSLNIEPFTLASHIAFLGTGMVNRVLKNGVVNTLGNNWILYKETFLPEEFLLLTSADGDSEGQES